MHVFVCSLYGSLGLVGYALGPFHFTNNNKKEEEDPRYGLPFTTYPTTTHTRTISTLA